jgi:5'(3')-deoxyribonucleotidase
MWAVHEGPCANGLAASARSSLEITALYLDVDEVVVKWVDAALRLTGHDPDDVYRLWDTIDPRPWDMFEVIHTSANRTWRAIDEAGAPFWANLEPFPWADELLTLCRSYAETTMLTSPSKHSSSHAGKADWMANYFGRDFRDYLLGSCKHRVAHPGALLVDDSPKNCAAFVKAGGHALLFPGIGNDLHALRHDPMPHVRQQLARLFNRQQKTNS